MTAPSGLRCATAADTPVLLALWDSLFAEADPSPWRGAAERWFEAHADDDTWSRFPVVEVDGVVVAAAIGTLELGVPNPHCPRGRAVRLANVVTRPAHRRRGHATAVVGDVVRWAERIGADRVDLSATPDGLGLYARLGFVVTSAPRMKLVL